MEQNFSDTLSNIIRNVTPDLKAISEEDYIIKFADKWSKSEILGHLIDSAHNNHRRFIQAKSKGDLRFSGYDEVKWVAQNNYQNRTHLDLVDFWALSNQHLASLWRQIDFADWTFTTTNHNFNEICMRPFPEGSPINLSYLAWDYLEHLEHHLVQILPEYQKSNPSYTLASH